ncbi:MAG: hypothetical protein AAB629_02265, partial [Patescibacteria group bacterium]
MPLKIESFEDEFIDKICKESVVDLNKFYEINWVHHLPVPIVVKDRKSIDLLKGEKTELWVVGWAEGNKVFILNHNSFESESDHKYSPERYYSLLKHEISHTFYRVLSDGHVKPIWLCEGVAIYTSGQNGEKRPVSHFKGFLDFYENGGKGVYDESGFAVHLLVREYGKQKLLDLIKGLKSIVSQKDFTALFVKTYGIKPIYDSFNKLLEKYPL